METCVNFKTNEAIINGVNIKISRYLELLKNVEAIEISKNDLLIDLFNISKYVATRFNDCYACFNCHGYNLIFTFHNKKTNMIYTYDEKNIIAVISNSKLIIPYTYANQLLEYSQESHDLLFICGSCEKSYYCSKCSDGKIFKFKNECEHTVIKKCVNKYCNKTVDVINNSSTEVCIKKFESIAKYYSVYCSLMCLRCVEMFKHYYKFKQCRTCLNVFKVGGNFYGHYYYYYCFMCDFKRFIISSKEEFYYKDYTLINVNNVLYVKKSNPIYIKNIYSVIRILYFNCDKDDVLVRFIKLPKDLFKYILKMVDSYLIPFANYFPENTEIEIRISNTRY